MENKQQIHNLVILDESGSMESIKQIIINGFNELIQNAKGIEKQFPDQEHLISFFSFNGLGIKMLHFLDPVSKINELNSISYSPGSLTPLYDAIGYTCNKLENVLSGQANQNYNVLVTILTDGEENDSKEYTQKSISELIKRLKESKWTFTYIGTDHDVTRVASNLNIDNHVAFARNIGSMGDLFNKEKRARVKYAMSINENKPIENFYDEED